MVEKYEEAYSGVICMNLIVSSGKPIMRLKKEKRRKCFSLAIRNLLSPLFFDSILLLRYSYTNLMIIQWNLDYPNYMKDTYMVRIIERVQINKSIY